jgi:hypothetical protein
MTSFDGGLGPNLEQRVVQKPRHPGFETVKDLDYLADNASCSSLSDLRRTVNGKERRGKREPNKPGVGWV